jgi:hypothetical protein
MMSKLSQQFVEVLESADTESAVIPPTLLYNEGWMLRLLLAVAAQGVDCFPFAFQPGARWFSEALLYSAFEARFRGDPSAESRTHPDGVVGHFVFTPGSKAGVALRPEATQFIVLEAKMFAALSKGTKNAPGFDQAARTVACMAETLRRAKIAVDRLESIAFFVVAPRSQITIGMFADEVGADCIRRKVRARVAQYDGVRRADLDAWLADYMEPLLSRLRVETLPWESIIDRLSEYETIIGATLREFYSKALRFNAPALLASE